MAQELQVRQSEKYEGGDWWQWAVWLEGPAEALDQVMLVEWTLHPTFPNPVRKTTSRSDNFRLESAGWGVFPIVVRVQMKDGTQQKLVHQLALQYPNGKPTLA